MFFASNLNDAAADNGRINICR